MPLSQILSTLLYINAIIVIAILIYEERDPSTTLAWAFLLIALPGVGLVFYLLFGRNWRIISERDKVRAEAIRRAEAAVASSYARWSEDAHEALAARPEAAHRISTAIARQNQTAPLPCTGLRIYASGAEKFDQLFADIEAAAESVHLQYFIWECDELTGRLCALLAEKVRAGVEVRVVYDWVGSLPYRKTQLKELEAAGAQVQPDAAHWTRLNYRNHWKIAVIDGRIGYTGGMNMGQEYIDGKPRYASWRDTHVRFGGPLVSDLQRMFSQRWFRITGESLFAERYFPPLDTDGAGRVVWGQLVYSGPETPWQSVRNAFLLSIASAKERVWIQSPYFVPDEAILESLVSQALGGVDVRFMMTGVPDKRIAWDAAFSYIDEIVEAGGRMFHYDAGFFHAKAMTIDGEIAVVGTTNFDIRSFMLHDELSIFFYDSDVAHELDEIFEADVAACHEVLPEHYRNLGRVRRFRNALSRLSSRLL